MWVLTLFFIPRIVFVEDCNYLFPECVIDFADLIFWAWSFLYWKIYQDPISFNFFFLFRASPAAYGSSQAKGWIKAVDALQPLDPSHVCDLHYSSWQHQILNPLSKATDWTHNLMVPSWIVSAAPRWELLKSYFFNIQIFMLNFIVFWLQIGKVYFV